MSDIFINSVFHPTDFSAGDRDAFQHALKIALCAKADLCLLHVKTDEASTKWGEFPHIRETLEDWGLLPKAHPEIKLSDIGLDAFNVSVSEADPVPAILHYLERHCFDLVVLATHQRKGFDRWMHEAVAEPIARRSGEMTLFVPRHCNGFVLPLDGSLSLKRILVPMDKSPNPEPALSAAFALAEALGVENAEFTTLHVGRPEDRPTFTLQEREGWKFDHKVVEGDPVGKILEVANELSADLIAMTTEGHKGFLDSLRGDTTERVLRESPCPLLAIHASRRKAPIL